jgi:hypothetical protein
VRRLSCAQARRVPVTPVLVAACVAVKAELKSTATAAIEMLRVRIKFLPMFLDAQLLNQRRTSVAVPPALSPKGQKRTSVSLYSITSLAVASSPGGDSEAKGLGGL